MTIRKSTPNDSLLDKILDAPLGQVVTVLGENLNCSVVLDIIEQNTPKPGTEFERKIIVSANDLPIIRATIQFDKNKLPETLVQELLKKRKMIGTLLNRNEIPNKKKIISLNLDREGKSLFRVYDIQNNDQSIFKISEEIKIDHLNSVRNLCLIPN